MKKIFQISFLIIFCWQFAGVFIHFQTSQQLIKNESERNITRDKHIISINLNKKQFNQLFWINKKEFRFQSDLYDVKSIKKVNRHYILKCYKDKKEKQLIKSISKINQEKDSKNESNSITIKVLNQYYISDHFSIFLENKNFNIKKTRIHFFYINNYVYAHNYSFIKPPIC